MPELTPENVEADHLTFVKTEIDRAAQVERRIFYDEVADEDLFLETNLEMMVCPKCGGTGSHVKESIDDGGITQTEWQRDFSHQEREAYMRGDYDVRCTECDGDNVVPDQMSMEETEDVLVSRFGEDAGGDLFDKVEDAYERFIEFERRRAAERRAERMMERGFAGRY